MRGKEIREREVGVEGPTHIDKDGRLAKSSPIHEAGAGVTLSAKPAERMGHPEAL